MSTYRIMAESSSTQDAPSVESKSLTEGQVIHWMIEAQRHHKLQYHGRGVWVERESDGQLMTLVDGQWDTRLVEDRG